MEVKRYDMIGVTRCGEAWQELQAEPEGEWVRYDDVLAVLKQARDALKLAEHKLDQFLQGQYNEPPYPSLGMLLSNIRAALASLEGIDAQH